MSKAAALKIAPDPTEAPRAEIRDALRKIGELKAQLVLNQQDIDAARESIRQTKTEIEDKRKELEATPALGKRKVRNALAGLEEHLEDLQAHLLELKRRKGHDPDFLQRDWKSLEAQIESEESRIKECRRQILKASPVVARLIDRFLAMRLELSVLQENIREIWSVGGIVPRKEAENFAPSDTFWASPPHGHILRPDPRWKAAIEALLSDPDTILPE
jgi:chromosome segregation ATPase